MKVIFKINTQLILLLLVVSSCEIQKRKYRSGYFINGVSNKQSESFSTKSNESHKSEIEITKKGNNRKERLSIQGIEQVDMPVKANRSICEQNIVVKSFVDVRKKGLVQKFETAKSNALKEDEKKEPYKPKVRTGILWLDWTIQIFAWICGAIVGAVLLLLLIGIFATQFAGLWPAIVIAFTTNLWPTLLYIVAFIVLVILIGIGMDKFFGFIFPNK